MAAASGTIAVSLATFIIISGTAYGQFDWGDGGGGGQSCSGAGTFQQAIALNTAVVVGDIPVGKEGVRIDLTSKADVDIQLYDASDDTKIVDWEGGILSGSTVESAVYAGMTIEYSGYYGDGVNLGNEYIKITGSATTKNLTMKAFGYAAGTATVDYSWTGTVGCEDSGGGPNVTGSGSFKQYIGKDELVKVGDLPASLTDVYVKLTSENDIDIQLYDGDIAIINWKGGIMSRKTYERIQQYEGVYIEYSGYCGQQTLEAFGNEYVRIQGELPRTLSLMVYGYGSGDAQIEYSWGYYESAKQSVSSNDGAALKKALHNIIDDHNEITYTKCWDALKLTDQDDDYPVNVTLLYSQRSQAKSTQDSGSGGDSWNREHVWAKSHGNFGTTKGPGTDIHALRPADASVNSSRNKRDFDDGGEQLSSDDSRGDCPLCLSDTDSFEPPDAVKGDVARMIFYMDVRYEGDDDEIDLRVVNYTDTPAGGDTSTTVGELGKLSTLLEWHRLDPVDNTERHRNNKIYDIQKNRNPFIDHPEWVEAIF